MGSAASFKAKHRPNHYVYHTKGNLVHHYMPHFLAIDPVVTGTVSACCKINFERICNGQAQGFLKALSRNPQLLPLPWFFDLFYELLFAAQPRFAIFFSKTSFSQQAKMLTSQLKIVAELASISSKKRQSLQNLAQRHNDYGVHPSFYGHFVEALMKALRFANGDDFPVYVEHCWNVSFSRLLYIILPTSIAGTAHWASEANFERLDESLESPSLPSLPHKSTSDWFRKFKFGLPLLKIEEKLSPFPASVGVHINRALLHKRSSLTKRFLTTTDLYNSIHVHVAKISAPLKRKSSSTSVLHHLMSPIQTETSPIQTSRKHRTRNSEDEQKHSYPEQLSHSVSIKSKQNNEQKHSYPERLSHSVTIKSGRNDDYFEDKYDQENETCNIPPSSPIGFGVAEDGFSRRQRFSTNRSFESISKLHW